MTLRLTDSGPGARAQRPAPVLVSVDRLVDEILAEVPEPGPAHWSSPSDWLLVCCWNLRSVLLQHPDSAHLLYACLADRAGPAARLRAAIVAGLSADGAPADAEAADLLLVTATAAIAMEERDRDPAATGGRRASGHSMAPISRFIEFLGATRTTRSQPVLARRP